MLRRRLPSGHGCTTVSSMKLVQLRNATCLLVYGGHRIVVDPMLSDVGAMPGFKVVGGGRRRNPLVPLPPEADEALASATAVLVTHEHPDHFDRPGLRWAQERRLPVWASAIDAPNLAKKGLDVLVLEEGAPGLDVEVVRSRHGRGLVGWLMGPVAGCVLAAEGEPTVYLTGDSILVDAVTEVIARRRPDVIVAPAGAANMGLGGDILFSPDELVALVRAAPGVVVANHLEALDHCPTTRAALRTRMEAEGLGARVFVPADGEALRFERDAARPHGVPQARAEARPGVQKWVTALFAP